MSACRSPSPLLARVLPLPASTSTPPRSSRSTRASPTSPPYRTPRSRKRAVPAASARRRTVKSWRTATSSSSACRRRLPNTATRIFPSSKRRHARSRRPSGLHNSSSWNRPPIPGRPTASCAPSSRKPGSGPAATSSSAFRRNVRIPAIRPTKRSAFRRSSPAMDRRLRP
ncbi:hypothetical protein D9M70_546780 [compost metagenome]